MPISISSFSTTNTLIPLVVPVVIESGALVQISIFDPTNQSALNSIYAEISIAHYHPTLAMREIILSQGLIGATSALIWSGHIISESNLYVVALTIADAVNPLRFSVMTNPY
jgi:hypothetical protein